MLVVCIFPSHPLGGSQSHCLHVLLILQFTMYFRCPCLIKAREQITAKRKITHVTIAGLDYDNL